MQIEQDMSTIDVFYTPSWVANSAMPHEHFFKRMQIESKISDIIDSHIIDVYE